MCRASRGGGGCETWKEYEGDTISVLIRWRGPSCRVQSLLPPHPVVFVVVVALDGGGAPLCVGSVGWGIGFLYDQCLLSALCVGSGEAGEAPCLRAWTDALERASCVTPTQTSVAGAMLGSGREGIPFEVSSSERGFWVIMGRQEDKEKTLPSVDCFKALSYRI